jgi:2-amino-4-hydroxy-6-hydroxymethyldihydropteridine diphosphokinase
VQVMRVYIGIGSNLGDRKKYIRHALERMCEFMSITRYSKPYHFPPYGFTHQPDFINMVIEGDTGLEPSHLLSELLQIEHDLGRQRAARWGPRVIDLDILFYEDITLFVNDGANPLIIPHPDMHKREFVLKPLADIAPDYVHPALHVTIRELFDALKK